MFAITLATKNTYAFSRILEGSDSCIPTTADILGPYYRSGAPFRSDLTVLGDPGTPLAFNGTVTGPDCNPIANALVDVWQAADDATYDSQSPQFNYRGRQYTDANGNYSFVSIKPGWYLNGNQYRPSHIHFRVTAPGHAELITQLYFQGDPYIAADPWASDPDAILRIVPITPVNNVDTASFNIALASNLGSETPQMHSPVQIISPFQQELQLKTSGELLQHIEVFTTSGVLIATQYNIGQASYSLNASAWASAAYYCRVQTATGIFVHKIVKN